MLPTNANEHASANANAIVSAITDANAIATATNLNVNAISYVNNLHLERDKLEESKQRNGES